MSALTALAGGLVDIGVLAYPQAAPFATAIKAALPYLEAAAPVVRAAIQEGPIAFAAAKQAAPELFGALTMLVAQAKGVLPSAVTDADLAHAASHILDIDPPGWTHEETVRWWEQASPGGY